MLRVLCCLLLLWALLPGWAGGGPAGVAVVYDPDDAVSLAVANHYQRARGIPERNMIPLVMPASLNGGNAWKLVEALRTALAERGLTEQLQGIALAGYLPLGASVAQGNGQVSLASMLYNSPNSTDPKAFPKMDGNNAYHLPPTAPTVCLNAATPLNGRSYWPVSHVGPTDRVAFSPRAALAAIDAGTAADGAKPDGVIYWPLNGDIRSTTREHEIAQVRPVWEAMGITYSVLDGVWVRGRGDIAGGVVGIAVTDAAADNRYLPGAWVDHLTSFGGVLWDNWQMPCTDFLLAGANGSSGTMGEPYAIAGKFPHAHIFTHFRNGASLAEAFWQSIQTTCEILPVGDPLMQPYATFPAVTITTPKRGVAVSGMMKFAVTAAGAIEPNLDLLIDGRRVTTAPAGGLALDTASLADGWHEARVIAYGATPVRTQGEAVLPLLVANRKQAVRLTGPATAAYDAPLTVAVAVNNLPNIAGIALRANGRTLATATAAGPVTIPARAIPFTGPCAVYAAATLADGTAISSAPLTVTVTWPPKPAANPVLGTGVARARTFASTTDKDFTWDGAATAEQALAESACQNRRLTCAVTSLSAAPPDWTKKPGFELTAWFQAPADDVYEFDLSPAGEVAVDSVVLAAQKNKLLGPIPLQAGWHVLRLRVATSDAKVTLKLQLRGGPVTKLNELPIAWLAAPAPANAPAPPKVTIVTAGAAPPVVTGTTMKLTADGPADLRYSWMTVAAPAVGATNHPDTMAEARFEPAQGRETTATFTAAGAYTLRVRAEGGGTSAVADVRVTVQPVATAVAVSAGRTAVFAGYPVDLYATVQDQFKRRMPNAPPVAWTAAAGACAALSGETARFRSGAEAGPCAITAAAAGKTGTLALTVKASLPPVLRTPPTFNQFGQGNTINLYAQAEDPQDAKNRDLTCQWRVEKAPAGHTVEFTTPQNPNTQAKLSGPGEYRVTFTATTPAGSLAVPMTITAAARDDGTLHYAPLARVNSSPVLVTQAARLYASGYTGSNATFVWETSADGGATWQPAPNGALQSLVYGPVTEADAARLFRVTVRNELGAMTSEPGKLTLNDPKGGLFTTDRTPILAGLNATSVTVTVHRTRHAAGRAVLDYTLTPFYPTPIAEKRAKPGVDYIEAKGTLTWENGDAADKTITITLPARPGAPGRGFTVQLMRKDGDIGLLAYGIPVWLPGAEELEGPK